MDQDMRLQIKNTAKALGDSIEKETGKKIANMIQVPGKEEDMILRAIFDDGSAMDILLEIEPAADGDIVFRIKGNYLRH